LGIYAPMKLTGHLRQAKEQGFAKFDTLVAVFLFGILALFLWPIASRLDGPSLKMFGGLVGFIAVLGVIRGWLLLHGKEPTLYSSLFFGGAAWVLIILGFTHLVANGYNVVLWLVPSTVLGLVTGIISYFRCRDKKLAKIAIWISGLPFAFLLLLILILVCSGPHAVSP
jgi:hypothetical protein